ncbi:TetR family transcriptional regulator C-terminal domain-containing protein [Streptomyces sp. NPDC060002]|uniref:TetR family transcriptional regulator C-terminal domain-containing protein n=1 Tax=Streptomyces sp. NPDC060002 TaxID=3347033 RepID=UPI0036B5D90C
MHASRESLTVDGQPAFPRLVIQVWTKTLRNPELAAILSEGYSGVREAWGRIVVAYQEAGMMRSDVSPDHVARTLIAVVLGFLVQQSLLGPAPVEVLRDGLRALMSVSAPLSGPESITARLTCSKCGPTSLPIHATRVFSPWPRNRAPHGPERGCEVGRATDPARAGEAADPRGGRRRREAPGPRAQAQPPGSRGPHHVAHPRRGA